jgi:hypothetical protein
VPEAEYSDNKITNRRPSSKEQPGNDLLAIYTYRETIHKLSILLIDADWSELKSDSTVIKTVEEQLRDTIKNLEKLRDRPMGKKVNMEGILRAINNALKELYRAKDLTKEENIQIISTLPKDKYERLESCRDYIELAMGLMPSKPEEDITDLSVSAESRLSTGTDAV